MLIEQTQNILHYSAETKPDKNNSEQIERLGFITLGFEDDHYFVAGGNRILNVDLERVKSKLTRIQEMDPLELKAYYREMRKKDQEATSKGAGLGFIELARKSSKPLEFNFIEIDPEYSFFCLKTVI